MLVKSGIYKLLNKVSGKIYIGSASNLYKRKGNHYTDLRANKHDNSHLQASWNIHGEEAFIFTVLERVEDKSKLVEREQLWLDFLQPFKDRGYNLNPRAGSNFGRKFSKEARTNMSRAQIGKKRSAEHIKNSADGNRGKKRSKEASMNISISLTGRKFTDQHRMNISNKLKGRKLTDTHRLNISNGLAEYKRNA